MKYLPLVAGITVIAVGAGIVVMSQQKREAEPNLQADAQLNNDIATAAGIAQQIPQAPTTPTSENEKAIPEAPPPAPKAVQPIAQATPAEKPKVQEPTIEVDEQTAADLKQSVENDFKSATRFPLTEEKMIAFATASIRVARINSKWDVQIASAETDKMAIEYNNFAVEEIKKSLENIPGLSLEEYNELTRLTLSNEQFSTIYHVYKQLAADGYFKNRAQAVAPSTVIPATPTTAQPAATKPVAAPVTPDKTPVPQGSPAPQYSPPASR